MDMNPRQIENVVSERSGYVWMGPKMAAGEVLNGKYLPVPCKSCLVPSERLL